MKVLSLSEAKINLGQIIDEVNSTNEGIAITKNGQPSAILLSFERYESLKETSSVQSDQRLMDEIKEGLKNLKKTRRLYTLQELFKE